MSFQKIASMFALLFAFALSAHADYLDSAGGPSVSASSSTSASAPAAADSQKQAVDTSKLLRCSKNYGSVAFQEQQMSPALTVTFSRVKLSTMYIVPLIRLAAKQSGCFTLVERGTPGVRYSLKMEMVPPTISNDVHMGRAMGLGMVPLFGGLLQRNEMERGVKNVFFSEAQTSLIIVDLKTGEFVAGVVGAAKNTDVSLGVALLSTAPSSLAGLPSQNASMQVVAASFADGFNQFVSVIDKPGISVLSSASAALDTTPVK